MTLFSHFQYQDFLNYNGFFFKYFLSILLHCDLFHFVTSRAKLALFFMCIITPLKRTHLGDRQTFIFVFHNYINPYWPQQIVIRFELGWPPRTPALSLFSVVISSRYTACLSNSWHIEIINIWSMLGKLFLLSIENYMYEVLVIFFKFQMLKEQLYLK